MTSRIEARHDTRAELAMPRLLSGGGTIVACLRRFDGSRTIIGSHRSADLQITGDPNIAASHAFIVWNAASDVHWLHDGDAPDGTFLNNLRLRQPTPLANGARIRIGSIELVYSRRLPMPGYVSTLTRRVRPMRHFVIPVHPTDS